MTILDMNRSSPFPAVRFQRSLRYHPAMRQVIGRRLLDVDVG
jgi:hypothetical protein